MADREGSPKYTPVEIAMFQIDRAVTVGDAIAGGARIVFTGDQIEKAREEMEAEFKRRKMEINKPLPPTSSQK